MKSLSEILGDAGEWRIVITDSGLGGLAICAALEKRLRRASLERPIRLFYVNAWPSASGGYNDMPDVGARAAVLDRALAAMTAYRPGFILVACNTLSVLYEMTEFSRWPAAPVAGIIDEGVRLFAETLKNDPGATLALFGTRTTIGSGEHVRRLNRAGVDTGRIVAAACHGLAGAVDKDPDASCLPGLVDSCVAQALEGARIEGSLYAGLCCTHYSLIADIFRRSLERRTGGRVGIIDPGDDLVEGLTAGLTGKRPEEADADIAVEVVSKVELAETQRAAFARRLELVSPRTARALVEYTRVPELF
jgi:glutamate racemase